ncbi:uncharacterized protein N7459_002023 [Penicillium hispanicum]|uniref:uncharacterized protein n=1 Tax=Penicillium hispanicum TaxID=1080232 RepID=UPI00253FB82F|nr:uncharacterized protein N7459_002023 [Penicillium hispanicum]KAJ5591654.1 hypothetical protein N7459_002023 [Penicillium hispanicum]
MISMSTENRPTEHLQATRCCAGIDSRPPSSSQMRIPIDQGLQWGSDPSFCYHGFSCPVGGWTEERLVRNLMRNVASMCKSLDVEFNMDQSLSDEIQEEKTVLTPLNGFDIPQIQRVDTGRSAVPASASVGLNCSVHLARRIEETAPPSKKRKCIQGPGQALCHCQTEKKRREAIGQGYRDLSQCVPGLRNSNFTRKYILDEAARYIEDLMAGNDALQQQLNVMNEQGK